MLLASAQGRRPPPPPRPHPRRPPEPAAPPPPSAESQRLHLVVYVDNWNLTPVHRNRVLRQLRSFLTDRLGPEDQVMLVTYGGQLYVYEFKIELEKGGHTVAVGIEDTAAASTSMLNGRVKVKVKG